MRSLACVTLMLLLASCAGAQSGAKAQPSQTARVLTAMLNQFMQDASDNNRAGFERFFADEVVYTGSNGMVRSKADIMRSLSAPKPATASAEKQTFSADKVVVRDFGNTAIVAFQLVARTQHADGKIEISNYRDTGTFLRRNGKWQVIAWQATKMPQKADAR